MTKLKIPYLQCLDKNWNTALKSEFEAKYLHELQLYLSAEQLSGKTIYPPPGLWLRALNLTPLDTVKVVVLGQDPYHGEGQAHGLAFSVPDFMKIPPSLRNIFEELQTDLNKPTPAHGNLENWTKQGVLLLNSVLTVEAGKAASHQGRGWENFTDAIIVELNRQQRPLVFVLWGKYAQMKARIINTEKHMVITAPHPSPFSAYSGFFGSKPFSRINSFLRTIGSSEIEWS